jgi:hypothetical protein
MNQSHACGRSVFSVFSLLASANETFVSCALSPDAFVSLSGITISARIYVDDLVVNADPRALFTVVPRPSVTAGSATVPVGSTLLNITGSGFDASGDASLLNQVSIKVDQGSYVPCIVQVTGATASSLTCRLSSNGTLAAPGGIITAIVRSFNGNSEPAAIGRIATPAPPVSAPSDGASRGDAIVNNTGLIAGLVSAGVVLVILVVILAIVLLRRRRQLADVKGAKQNVPAEMAAMFNIKSSDLEIVKKLGEGSFGAVYLCTWRKDGTERQVALKKLIGSMMSAHVNDFFREATLMTGIAPHKNIVRYVEVLCFVRFGQLNLLPRNSESMDCVKRHPISH